MFQKRLSVRDEFLVQVNKSAKKKKKNEVSIQPFWLNKICNL